MITDLTTGTAKSLEQDLLDAHGTCDHCGKLRPLQDDGLVAIHYLRRKQAGRNRRERCKGSRHLPREEQS